MIFLKGEKSKISWRKEDTTYRKMIDKIKFISQIHHQLKKDNVVTCIQDNKKSKPSILYKSKAKVINYGLQGKSSLLPVLYVQLYYWNIALPIHLYFVYGCSPATMTELILERKTTQSARPQIFTISHFTEKHLLTSDLSYHLNTRVNYRCSQAYIISGIVPQKDSL